MTLVRAPVAAPAVAVARVHLSKGTELANRTELLRSALDGRKADASELSSLIEGVLRASTMSLAPTEQALLRNAEERLKTLSATQTSPLERGASYSGLRVARGMREEEGGSSDEEAASASLEGEEGEVTGDEAGFAGEGAGARPRGAFGSMSSLHGYEAFMDEGEHANAEGGEEADGPPKTLLLLCGLCRCVLCPLLAAAAVFLFLYLPASGALPPAWWHPCAPTVARGRDGSCLPYNWERVDNASIDAAAMYIFPKGERFLPVLRGQPVLCQALCIDTPTCHGFVIHEASQTCHFLGGTHSDYDLWLARREARASTLWLLWGSHALPPSPPPPSPPTGWWG